ncbi:antifreeze protein [Albirhodobacter sp. R86504]|jgi:hypothetical protein|uniref:antifreeze protein n=1 Tax=Albirhodobacter sp. R86504 TaxID=3093848 RepID=UPI00366AA19D
MKHLFAPWYLGVEMVQMAAEAQAVIAMRTAGMMGFWATKPSEMDRMVAEKTTAAMDSMQAAQRAALAGKSPADVMRAGLKPIGRKTAANAKRLGNLGPSVPKPK